MTGRQNIQRELFPLFGDGLRRRTIAPGDWLSIEHEGKTVVGMIYRRKKNDYSFVYWDNLILRFGTTTRDHIGPWIEELTSQFRGQIAVMPNYVEKCIAAWVMQSEPPAKIKPDFSNWKSGKFEPSKVQKRLFPE